MKKEFLVAAPGNQKGETEETRITGNAVFNPFRKWLGKKDVPQPAFGDISADKAREYAAVFLVRKESVHRKQTYISHETYTTLARILPLLCDGMTVPVFLDNVLTHHLETYAEELKELFRCKAGYVESNKGQTVAPCLQNEVEEYISAFLSRKESVHRRQTYISHETYKTLARILPLLCDGMTVPVFLDNVLTNHLETYVQELNELTNRKTRNMQFRVSGK